MVFFCDCSSAQLDRQSMIVSWHYVCEWMYDFYYLSHFWFSCCQIIWECMTHSFPLVLFCFRFVDGWHTGHLFCLVGDLFFRKVISQSVKLCCDSSTLCLRQQGLSCKGLSRNPEERESPCIQNKELADETLCHWHVLSAWLPFSLRWIILHNLVLTGAGCALVLIINKNQTSNSICIWESWTAELDLWKRAQFYVRHIDRNVWIVLHFAPGLYDYLLSLCV